MPKLAAVFYAKVMTGHPSAAWQKCGAYLSLQVLLVINKQLKIKPLGCIHGVFLEVLTGSPLQQGVLKGGDNPMDPGLRAWLEACAVK